MDWGIRLSVRGRYFFIALLTASSITVRSSPRTSQQSHEKRKSSQMLSKKVLGIASCRVCTIASCTRRLPHSLTPLAHSLGFCSMLRCFPFGVRSPIELKHTVCLSLMHCR